MSAARPRRSRPRLLFILGAVVVAVLALEAGSRVLEVVVHRVEAAQPDTRFARPANVVPVFKLSEDETRWVRTEHHWILGNQSFAATRESGSLRVFCLGGSAAQGWPHHPDSSFPGLLQAKLEQLLPGHQVEVVNAGGNTYGSHRVRIVFEEIVHYEPDLVVVMSGNNEFVEKVVATDPEPQLPPGPWRHLAFGRLIQRAARGTERLQQVFDVKDYGPRDLVMNRLDSAFGGVLEHRVDSLSFALIRKFYERNIDAIVTGCRDRGLPVILLTPPVNLEDWRPSTSVHSEILSPSELGRWESLFREGYLALEQGDAARAADVLRNAATIDPIHAETWYLLGRALHRLERFDEARMAFLAAAEDDPFPVRSMVNPIVRRIAEARDVPLVDADRLLESHTLDGINGNDELVDYVHPKVVANERIAHAIAGRILEMGVLPAAPAVPLEATWRRFPPDIEEETWTLRGLFGQCLVLRQFDDLPELAARLHRAATLIMPELDAEEQRSLRSVLERVDATIPVTEAYSRVLRAEKLGRLDDEYTPEQVEEIFDAYVELIEKTEAHFVTRTEFNAFVPRPPGE